MSPGSDLIKVARGKYFPTKLLLPGDPRYATFLLIHEVTIEGGYAGVTAEPGHEDDRDVDLYETILSGDIGIPQQTFDNSYQVVTSGGDSLIAELNGFTISDGNANVILGPFGGYIGGGMLILNSDPVVVRCTFTNNFAGKGGGIFVMGDVMHNYVAEPLIVNCKISENSGGAGAGMGVFELAEVMVVNSIITDNSAGAGAHGGAIFLRFGGIVTLTNSTLSANTAFAGGGLTVWAPSQAILQNCIVWGNTPDAIETDDGGVTVNYSDVEGGWGGTGNIDADPLFVAPGNDDFRLRKCSPAIDAADNVPVPSDDFDVDDDMDLMEKTPDLDLNDRAFDDPIMPNTGNQDGDPPVDMGAYERLDPCPWDLNGDCCVDEDDLAILIAAAGPCPPLPADCPADFDCDGSVGRLDHGELMKNFGPCATGPDPQFCQAPDCDLVTSAAALGGALAQIGFADVAAYVAWVPPASESEAYVCACMLHALLEAQP